MRLVNIETIGRIHAAPRTTDYSASSLTLDSSTQLSLSIDASGTSKSVVFDKAFDQAPIHHVIQSALDGQSLGALLDGISLGVFRLDVGEDGGSRSELFTTILEKLSQILPSSCQLSYGLYSLSDGHCVDMISFDQLDLEEVQQIASSTTMPLEPIENFSSVIENVKKGYSGACVLLVRIRKEVQDGSVRWSTLAVGDLGTIQANSFPLEHSIANLKNIILSLEQPFAGFEIGFDQSLLTALIKPFIGGSSFTKFIFSLTNYSIGVETKLLHQSLNLAESIRKVKCRPEAAIEVPEVRQLAALIEAHQVLESQQAETKAQVKKLKKNLTLMTKEKARIVEDASLEKTCSATEKAERDWKMAKLTLKNVEIQDQLRKCEIELVWMEHQRSMLRASIHESKFKLEQSERRRMREAEEKENNRKAYSQEISKLSSQLAESNRSLEETVRQLEKEGKDQNKAAAYQVAQLEAKLNQAEAVRRKLESDLDETKKGWQEDQKQLTEQERKYSQELSAAITKAKREEDSLRDQLSMASRDQREASHTIEKLQREISSLKIENASLTAKLDVYTRFQPSFQQQAPAPVKSPKKKPDDGGAQVKLALAQIESRMAQERTAMIELVKTIKSSSAAAAEEKENKSNSAKPVAKFIPEKRSNKKKESDEHDEVYSGAEDDEAEQQQKLASKTIKLKPKKQPAPTPTIKEPAPQLFVKKPPTRKPAIPLIPSTKDLPSIVPSGLQSPTKHAGSNSPVKPALTKPSAFIPGVGKATTVTGGGGRPKPSFLSNLSFDEANRKRIKLPERSGPAAGIPTTAAPVHRNVDPAVYSAIVSNFNISK